MARATRSDASAALLFPAVRFEADFMRRIERFTAAFAASRTRREELGALGGSHGGHEFIGYRAYARGDDVRRIDWNLYARLDRPFVRVTRREAGEVWSIALDASASMGVGPPGKLQRAAEIVAALAASALRASSRAEVSVIGHDRAAVVVAERADLPRLLAFLEPLVARGAVGPNELARVGSKGARSASRVFLVSDLLSFAPEHVVRLASARRSVTAIRVLAPHELAAEGDGPTEWLDPETGELLALDVSLARAGYAHVLAGELERWRARCARAGVRHSTASSASAFEDILTRGLRG